MPTIDLGSVVGPQGAQGPQGATGATGAQGAAGPNQVTAATSTTLTGALVGDGSTISARTIDSTPSSSHTNNLISSAAVADAINSAGNFAAPTTLDEETDLNTITDSGCYRCSSATRARTIVNAPWVVNSDQGEAFVLFVVKNNASSSTYFIQQLITPSVVYTRRHYDTTWSSWTSMREKVESDLASVSLWGSTNTTGATITKGTYFYRKGALVCAIADIANNATLTSGTNYEAVTVGGLNKISSDILSRFGENLQYVGKFGGATSGQTYTYTLEQDSRPFLVFIYRDSYGGSTGNADTLGLYPF